MIVTDDQLYTLQAALLKLLQKLSPVNLCLAESTAHANHLTLAPAIDAGRFQDGHILKYCPGDEPSRSGRPGGTVRGKSQGLKFSTDDREFRPPRADATRRARRRG